MKKKFSKKVMGAFLSMMLVLGMSPCFAHAAGADFDLSSGDDYYKLISKTDWDIAPGIVESEIVLNNSDGSHRQVAHVMEADLSNEYVTVMPSYKGMNPTEGNYGVQIMSQQASWVEDNWGLNVVGAMNLSLSWYDSAYYKEHPELVGEPLGYMVLNGEYYENSQGKTSGAQTCVVINFDEKDGVARPADMPKVQIRSTSDEVTGWEEQVIPANFGFLVKDGVNQYKQDHAAANGASRSFVGVKADGTLVMVMNDGRQAPYSTGFTNYEMAEFMLSLGCVAAVNGDGGGSSAFLSQRPGEDLKLNCSPSDGAERETTHGILVISGAPSTGEFVRASVSAEEHFYTPNSEVQFTAVGSDLAGAAAEIPADATWALADDSFGTIDENGLFVSNGKEGEVTAQVVYNGEVVGSSTVEIVMPDSLEFGQSSLTVPFGKTVKLSLTAKIGARNVVFKASDVEFNLSDKSLGTIDGLSFTASEEGAGASTGVLTAKIGNVEAQANIVLGKGSEISYDFEDGDASKWVVDDQYGKYGPVGPNGSVTDANGNYWYNGQNEIGSVEIVTAENGKVRSGESALAINCDFTQIYETGYHGLIYRFPETIDITDAVSVGFWLYVPEEAKHAEVRLGLGGSAVTLYDNGQLYDLKEGWNYVSCDVTDISTKTWSYINIQIDDRACSSKAAYYDYTTEANLNGKYTFYVDELTVDYSTAVADRELPVFQEPVVLSANGETSEALKGQTVSRNTLTFEASVADDKTKDNFTGLDATTAKAFIDGAEVDCSYKNGKFSIADVKLADGVHTVAFSICDEAGNEGSIARKIDVQAGSDASTIKVVPQNTELDKLPIGSLYYVDVVATDIETVKSVEVDLDLNNASQWELDHMDVAEGFEASYKVDAADNIATIVFKRTEKTAATGEAVIASLPIRTWESTITECEGYEDQTPEKLWSRGIIWAKSLILEVDRGVVEYVDGYEAAARGTFGAADLEVDTEVWYTYYSRKSVEGAVEDYTSKKSWHVHDAQSVDDKNATCTEDGYSGRTFCETCNSVVDWGETTKASGHDYEITDGVYQCGGCDKLYNGWKDDVYYYVDGVMATEAAVIDGKVYVFNEDGTLDKDGVFNGLLKSGEDLYNVSENHLVTGWVEVEGSWYYFDKKSGKAVNGEATIDDHTYKFENHVLVDGAWERDDTGLMCWWAGEQVFSQWITIDGKKYHFTGSYANTGVSKVAISTDKGYQWCVFDENGVFLENVNGLYRSEGNTYYAVDGVCQYAGLVQDEEGRYYYINSTLKAVKDCTYSFAKVNGLWPEGSYTCEFDSDGRIINPPVEDGDGEEPAIKNGIVKDDDGYIRYYVDGEPQYAGLVLVDGRYYYVCSGKFAIADRTYFVSRTNGLVPAGEYTFDSEGRMTNPPVEDGDGEEPAIKNGIVKDDDGYIRYYVDGEPQYAGLVLVDGHYYYVCSGKFAIADRTYFVSRTNGLVPAGEYTFDSEGRMTNPPVEDGDGEEPAIKNGIVKDGDGYIRYYVDGEPQYAGLVLVDGRYYYVCSGKFAIADRTYFVSRTNGFVPAGEYTFDSEGRMTNPPEQM